MNFSTDPNLSYTMRQSGCQNNHSSRKHLHLCDG